MFHNPFHRKGPREHHDDDVASGRSNRRIGDHVPYDTLGHLWVEFDASTMVSFLLGCGRDIAALSVSYDLKALCAVVQTALESNDRQADTMPVNGHGPRKRAALFHA